MQLVVTYLGNYDDSRIIYTHQINVYIVAILCDFCSFAVVFFVCCAPTTFWLDLKNGFLRARWGRTKMPIAEGWCVRYVHTYIQTQNTFVFARNINRARILCSINRLRHVIGIRNYTLIVFYRANGPQTTIASFFGDLLMLVAFLRVVCCQMFGRWRIEMAI